MTVPPGGGLRGVNAINPALLVSPKRYDRDGVPWKEIVTPHGSRALQGWTDPQAMVDILVALEVRPAWMRDALCREHPEAAWFPERGVSTAPAKAICRACLVREECLEWALATGQKFGILGGMSERERRKLRQARRRAGEPSRPRTDWHDTHYATHDDTPRDRDQNGRFLPGDPAA